MTFFVMALFSGGAITFAALAGAAALFVVAVAMLADAACGFGSVVCCHRCIIADGVVTVMCSFAPFAG